MKILHITRGFYYTKVYRSLFDQLVDKCDLEVYAPKNEYLDKNVSTPSNQKYKVYSSEIIRRQDNITYYPKIKRMNKDMNSTIEISKFNIIHAHSWFSDGAVAYENYKQNGTPYIVAIRNTDINKYFKFALHIRGYGYKILNNAKKIIFISESYRNKVLSGLLPEKVANQISDKAIVVPNGLDDFWFNGQKKNMEPKDDKLDLIFVGKIDKNKNLESVIKASLILQKQNNNSKLNIVGDGELFNKLNERYASENIIFHGKIKNNESLRKLYLASDILVVPSFNETFGLAYIEAMSCGVPPIYSKGEGIDGQFKEILIGENVDPHNPETIVDKVNKIKDNYEEYSTNSALAIKEYSWSNIANTYMDIYKNVIANN